MICTLILISMMFLIHRNFVSVPFQRDEVHGRPTSFSPKLFSTGLESYLAFYSAAAFSRTANISRRNRALHQDDKAYCFWKRPTIRHLSWYFNGLFIRWGGWFVPSNIESCFSSQSEMLCACKALLAAVCLQSTILLNFLPTTLCETLFSVSIQYFMLSFSQAQNTSTYSSANKRYHGQTQTS